MDSRRAEEFNAHRYPKRFLSKADLRHYIVRNMIRGGVRKKVLDVGCNDGLLGQLLIKDGHEVFGVDVSETALDLARERGLKVNRVNLDTDDLPFENESFDVVTVCEVIAHIYDTGHLFKEINRVLKKRGLFVISTPNAVSLGRRAAYLFGIGAFFEASLEDENAAGAIRFFTKDLLLNMLKRHRFEPQELTSDFINIGKRGTIRSRRLARLFPTLGASLIVSSRKV